MEQRSEFSVFYSWQSDLPKKINNYFILNSIRKACSALKKDVEIKVDPRVDKDTLNVPGSPDIVDVIFKKISLSNIFICDVTPIYKNRLKKNRKGKNSPNANVLIELGYAVKTMGWNRIICICNEAYGKVVILPFNISQNRISVYSLDKNGDKRLVQEKLSVLLVTAIKSIVIHYEKILKESRKDDILIHDLNIFQELNKIFTSNELLEMTEYIGTYFINNTKNLNRMRSFQDFLRSAENEFLIDAIQKMSKLLLISFEKFMGELAGNLFVEKSEKVLNPITHLEETEFTYSIAPYERHERGWTYEEYEREQKKRRDKIVAASFHLDKAYKNFRKTIKENLFI